MSDPLQWSAPSAGDQEVDPSHAQLILTGSGNLAHEDALELATMIADRLKKPVAVIGEDGEVTFRVQPRRTDDD